MKINVSRKRIMMLVVSILIILGMSVVFIGNSYADNTIAGVKLNPSTDISAGSITKMGNRIIGLIQVVGVLLAVGILMVVGIKYMMGSAEEKAEYKKVMIPYVIGAIILFAASAIAPAVANVIEGMAK